MENSPPHDKFNLIFIIFTLHGLGTLMPWNMFITAKQYFVDFKLNVTQVEGDDASFNSIYATNFLAYIGFASQIPNIIFNWLNVFVHMGGELTKRIVISLLIEICIFLVTVILAMLDSTSWPGLFFWLTMLSVVILNMANGVYQNTVFGLVATLPIKYTGCVVLGANVSGVIVTLISISSSLVFSSQRTAAIYYFITAMLVLLLCLDTYFALPLNKYYRYHQLMRAKEVKRAVGSDDTGKPPYWEIFKQASPQLFNVFLVFFVTLSIFPAVHSDIKPTDSEFFVPEKLFPAITCYLTFNFFAMLGSCLPSFVIWPSPERLWIPVALRILFMPFFLFCNYQPINLVRTLPVYIKNEYVYWLGAILMAFSSGYLSAIGMMYAPHTVAQKHQITAGMFAAACLITGVFTGITFTMVFPILASNISF